MRLTCASEQRILLIQMRPFSNCRFSQSSSSMGSKVRHFFLASGSGGNGLSRKRPCSRPTLSMMTILTLWSTGKRSTRAWKLSSVSSPSFGGKSSMARCRSGKPNSMEKYLHSIWSTAFDSNCLSQHPSRTMQCSTRTASIAFSSTSFNLLATAPHQLRSSGWSATSRAILTTSEGNATSSPAAKFSPSRIPAVSSGRSRGASGTGTGLQASHASASTGSKPPPPAAGCNAPAASAA
mmetsp:Transcript_60661/g.162362  ORF Transcript_60661/g.162362 Transcript_60661/m.162362 type:complete len:237 (-) Transcript_60661:116-826(-)